MVTLQITINQSQHHVWILLFMELHAHSSFELDELLYGQVDGYSHNVLQCYQYMITLPIM